MTAKIINLGFRGQVVNLILVLTAVMAEAWAVKFGMCVLAKRSRLLVQMLLRHARQNRVR
jgi:hypothetical protein